MPELPEVEVVRRGADHWFVGRTIENVEVLHPRSIRRHLAGPDDFAARLRGTDLASSSRRGKFMWFQLGSGEVLITHLGMSGQLRVNEPDTAPSSHLRIKIDFADGRDSLWFVDQRTFGGMCLDELTDDGTAPSTLAHIAPDPFDPAFDQAAVARKIRTKTTAIKSAILDQTVVSGIGNIYADEALWRTKLHWSRPSNTISQPKIKELLANAADVMSEALEQGGTSFDSLYVNVNGSSGYFGRHLSAYGQAGKPCDRCGTLIIRQQFANRSSFTCPRCQRPDTVKG